MRHRHLFGTRYIKMVLQGDIQCVCGQGSPWGLKFNSLKWLKTHYTFFFNKQPGLTFLKVTIEYNRILLYLTIENKRKFKQFSGLGLTQIAY